MPRYQYECEQCEAKIKVFHTFSETYEDCIECNTTGSLRKLLTTPFITRNKLSQNKEEKIGNLTKKKIEENRQILEQQKKETRNKSYDET